MSWRCLRTLRLGAIFLALGMGMPGASAQELTPTPLSPPEAVERVEHNILHRPIELADGLTHWADRSYPYGSTQQGVRPVHLGVEFVNPRGTPVYASLAGTVVYASDDSETLLGPVLDYYGNVVVIAHELESLAGERIFTLYGHLRSVAVESGQTLGDLDLIGRVGSSGVAIGAHLHFEVRAEDPFDYRATRNPALWLQHYRGRGLIAGSLRDAAGETIYGKRLRLRNENMQRDVYTYADDSVNPDSVWDENFTISDLPAGDYQLIMLKDNGAIAYRETLSVEPLRTTFVEIVLD